MLERFYNRVQAGTFLANDVAKKYDNVNKNVIILALPRGGVPVAYQIAQKIKAPLDVFLVRKIGVEGHEELAVGAITENSKIFNDNIIKMLHIGQDSINRVIKRETEELRRRNQLYRKGKPAPDVTGKIVILTEELRRRNQLYRKGKPAPDVTGKIVILVDGKYFYYYYTYGIATGATMRAAYTSLKKLKPAEIVVAVPVAAPDTLSKVSKEVDNTICVMVPRNLGGIGQFYIDFSQTEDAEVLELLNKAEEEYPVPTISAEDTIKYQNETILE
ncbi:hypothetical protein Glove_42g36 [Diversispora epigaea]|uniref:Phosphoribosyltransferase domain-containing protein n=1 Tax=Diversispora epigaea TaxID=1348612 RepID=A0A397JF44_9GLOM|nr:hypothetical protein Glove_42g36 [Diversispora epigaea]